MFHLIPTTANHETISPFQPAPKKKKILSVEKVRIVIGEESE